MFYILTINREYGSGGRFIGKIVAEKLGIPYYDKELIAKTAQKSGFTEEFINEISEKKTTSLLYSLYMTSIPVSDQLFIAQSQVINDIAKEGSAVIVGGCADFVLQNHPKCFNVFIHAPLEERIRRVKDEYNEAVGDIRSYILKKDKKRMSYYNYFTQFKWANATNYNLSINSSIGVEDTAEIIVAALKSFIKKT
ncbi:MAG: cytidylate kinase-like family protein [Eubacterium sp.]|jgi:cytidylate kinase|nr:cytidylate kinase-like family protein [Eubacterium sp.]